MAHKSDSQLALDEKIDLARTLIRWKHRAESRRELNELETSIAETHEDDDGNYSSIDATALIASLAGKKQLDSGKD